MSINRILSNGYMGMMAQSHQLGTISTNIANAQTVGYKREETQFKDFVVDRERYSERLDGAGVRSYDRLRVDSPGTIQQTGQTTNAAITGNGFFVVQEIDVATGDAATAPKGVAGRPIELTRTGDFNADLYGNLVNNTGRALMGTRITEENPTGHAAGVGDLELVSVDAMRAYVEGTSELSVAGNLPTTQPTSADPNPDEGVTTVVSVVDQTGKRAAVDLSFVRTAQNADGTSSWDIFENGAVYEDGSAVPRTGPAGRLGTVNFDPSGFLTGGDRGTDVTLAMNLGENFRPISLNLGQVGNMTGLRSVPGDTYGGFASGNNGVAAGSYRDVEITSDGLVRATFAGSQTRDFYRIPNAVVTNPTDLQSVSGTAFQVTENSGEIRLKDFGAASTPTEEGETPMTVGAALVTGAVEGSNTDIAQEFTTLIVAQRTYSANTKIITTGDEMTQTALSLRA